MQKGFRLFAIVCLIAAFAVTGCAGIKLKPGAGTEAVGSGAALLGYKIGERSPEKIDQLCGWVDKICEWISKTDGPTDFDLKEKLIEGFDYVVNDSFERLIFMELVNMLDFNIETKIEMPSVLTEQRVEQIRTILAGFKRGLNIARPDS